MTQLFSFGLGTLFVQNMNTLFNPLFGAEMNILQSSGVTIRYDTRCYFNVRSKADISQLNLPHGTDN